MIVYFMGEEFDHLESGAPWHSVLVFMSFDIMIYGLLGCYLYSVPKPFISSIMTRKLC